MRRRGLIALFIVAMIVSPGVAYAQKGALPTIGYLGFDSAEKSKELLVAFREGLRTRGFVEGQNVAIEYRFADGKYDRFPELIAGLIRDRVQVIVAATGTNGVLATTAATKTIPIVFAIAMGPRTPWRCFQFEQTGRECDWREHVHSATYCQAT